MIDAHRFPGPALFQGLGFIAIGIWIGVMVLRDKLKDRAARKRQHDAFMKHEREHDERMAAVNAYLASGKRDRSLLDVYQGYDPTKDSK